MNFKLYWLRLTCGLLWTYRMNQFKKMIGMKK